MVTTALGKSSDTASEEAASDIVGGRVLVGAQMIDISRLSAHPIPMVNGGLVTIAGQGPKDSNGAGKSSFIAAMSLLCADDQWRLGGGAPGAAELLFTAEVAAQDGRWTNVDRAYIIGVFADPLAGIPEALSASALTVWLRINRKAPYIDLRWQVGLYVPTGANDAERVSVANNMWNALPRQNGRHDVHAARLGATLYGPHVRCVSFLSTSVRSGSAPNLIAQPLNDLTPVQIFNAIAALTGLDRELEQEQALRTAEHAHRVKVGEAEVDLRRWEREMTSVEEGIERRTKGRNQLDHTLGTWRSHCALHLLEGQARADEIHAKVQRLKTEWDTGEIELGHLRRERADLLDDQVFRGQCEAAAVLAKTLEVRDRQFDFDLREANKRIEDLTKERTSQLELAREADGRDRATAQEELDTAARLREEAIEAVGGARKEEEAARSRLTDAERGHDLAGQQLVRLREDGIEAIALLDAVALAEEQRAIWEPRLIPYNDAIVLHARDIRRALELLADLPGSMMVPADADDGFEPGADGQLPSIANPQFGLRRFLAVLARRAAPDDDGGIDRETGVVVIGGFSAPTTGRASRIARARERFTAAAADVREAERQARLANARLATAQRRHQAVVASEKAESCRIAIAEQRMEAQKIFKEWEDAKPAFAQAVEAHIRMCAAQATRDERVTELARRIRDKDQSQAANVNERAQLVRDRGAVDLDARIRQWGGTVEDAYQYITDQEEQFQRRSAEDWARDACHQLDMVLRICFPVGTTEEVPTEIRESIADGEWDRADIERRRQLFPRLYSAVRTYLAQTAQHDAYQLEQISAQRSSRTADFDAARRGLEEARLAADAHRSSLSHGIKARLKQVAAEFNRLDLDHGGYGADLDFPEPEPPADTDKPWRWTVTPRWRRAEGQRPSPYNLRGNTAQMDEKAVKLVCAAALAGGGDRPLMLILDELGRNLGKQHRREAVALFERIGRARNITVVGALQDDMEPYAVEASGLYIKLRRGSDLQAYNDPPVIVGHDHEVERVAMLQDWLNIGRPERALGPRRTDDR
jgi:chromosome segregation protein